MHLESISNGFGSQSMAQLILRKEGRIVGDISQSADTGSEIDCLLSDGRRMSAKLFFESVIMPYCQSIGIEAAFVRTRKNDGSELPPLHEVMSLQQEGRIGATPAFVPLFGSKMGRMAQQCTDKWKIRALRQNARRLGAKTMRSAIGLHCEEMGRVSGKLIRPKVGEFNVFQDGTEDKNGIWHPLQWCSKYYPIIDLGMTREDCRNLCKKEGLPYMISSQCFMCPHQDGPRWNRNTPELNAQAAQLEEGFAGNFFLTDQRIPLMMAIPNMKQDDEQNDFGCQNDQCGF